MSQPKVGVGTRRAESYVGNSHLVIVVALVAKRKDMERNAKVRKA